jgi:hypothetical protein
VTLEVNIVGDLAKLALKPGDKLVFSADRLLHADAVERIKEELERIAPGHEVVIICDGCKLEVLESA